MRKFALKCLFVWRLSSHSKMFHSYEDVTIAGEGQQTFDLCSALMAIEQWVFFNVPHLLRHGPTLYIQWKQIVHEGLYFIRLDRQRTKNSQTLSLSLSISLSEIRKTKKKTQQGFCHLLHFNLFLWEKEEEKSDSNTNKAVWFSLLCQFSLIDYKGGLSALILLSPFETRF